MTARLAEGILIALVATVLIGVIAAPVIRSPSTRVFGAPIVGTHHDPFTMMQVWESPVATRTSFQPVTDLPGHWLAAAVGPVAAYNWLVLISFPLAAVASYALARHLAIPRFAAGLAALAFAFSPFHLAHAAYHPHIAQVQWVPLYVLALWYALARGSALAMVGVFASTAAVVLSNFYGGLIVGVLTPLLVLAGWWLTRTVRPRPAYRLVLVSSTLAAVTICGAAYVALFAPAALMNRRGASVPAEEIHAYSARGIAFLVPPAAHPWMGAAVRERWRQAGIASALLEQQVSLGWGIVALAVVATGSWLKSFRGIPHTSLVRPVPALLAVAVVAAVLSSVPDVVIASGLHELAPMFRAYARFGVMVQLMAVLLAAIGLALLRQRATPAARWLAVVLVLCAVGEYVVSPAAASREVWPTASHRWVHDYPGDIRVLDCMPFSAPIASTAWLTRGRIQLLGGPFDDCGESGLAPKLAALGFSHVIVRAQSDDARAFDAVDPPAGLALVQRDHDAGVWRVAADVPALYVVMTTGLSPRERDGDASWRWMGSNAEWRIANPGEAPVLATLRIELSAFHHPRTMTVGLDADTAQQVVVSPGRQVHVIGPWSVTPGHHTVTFRAIAEPTAPATVGPGGDTRPLTVAFGEWHWSTIRKVE